MTAETKDRIDLLQTGLGIAGEYQRAKCAALRVNEIAISEDELRQHCPRFEAACKDWYEWVDEFRQSYQRRSKSLLGQPTDWLIREY